MSTQVLSGPHYWKNLSRFPYQKRTIEETLPIVVTASYTKHFSETGTYSEKSLLRVHNAKAEAVLGLLVFLSQTQSAISTRHITTPHLPRGMKCVTDASVRRKGKTWQSYDALRYQLVTRLSREIISNDSKKKKRTWLVLSEKPFAIYIMLDFRN